MLLVAVRSIRRRRIRGVRGRRLKSERSISFDLWKYRNGLREISVAREKGRQEQGGRQSPAKHKRHKAESGIAAMGRRPAAAATLLPGSRGRSLSRDGMFESVTGKDAPRGEGTRGGCCLASRGGGTCNRWQRGARDISRIVSGVEHFTNLVPALLGISFFVAAEPGGCGTRPTILRARRPDSLGWPAESRVNSAYASTRVNKIAPRQREVSRRF